MEAVASTVQLLSDLLLDKIDSLRAVQGKVELLKDELKHIQCYLKDANQKQADNEGISNWISEIREVALDSRDVIEMFILKVESKSRLGRLSTIPKRKYYKKKVEEEIDAIQKRLQAIYRSRESYGIRDLGEDVESVSGWRAESWRRMRDEHLVGLGGDVWKLESILDLDQSWELFVKKAFIHAKHPQCPEELEPIGRQIVEKCNGLPLAIAVVGALLVEPHTKRRWEEVLEEVNSGHRRAESRISTILELSYRNLSPLLKSCFLCLACFKEDADIPTKRLIHIWVGHGLIRPEGRRTVDEIARGYLNELIDRNMVQIKDLTLDGRVKNCRLHSLFREVCLEKAKEELGFQIIEKGKEEDAMMRTTKPRYRIVYGQNLDTLSRDQTSHLRSLFVINSHSDGLNDDGVKTPFRFWKSFKLLEILYLEGVGWLDFPDSFRSLIGLRYLRIRTGSSKRIQIPGWFGHLEKLEILDAMSENLELPHTNPEMERLRYFSAARIRGLTAMQSLKHVETLKYIGVDDLLRCRSLSTCPVRELGLFLDQGRESEVVKRARASLERMMSLVKLELKWDLLLSIEPIMIPRLAGLTKLKLRGGLRRCPDSGVFPPNLTYLTLADTYLKEDPMVELGKLPNLKYLKLTGCAYLGERMRVLHGGFLSLKGLSIKDMYSLEGIDVEEGGMPQLKVLRVSHCSALETINLPQRILASLSST